MKCVILAGGLGTRLRSVIGDLPKCMAPINEEPFLAHKLRHLASQGINDIMLSVGYRKDVIMKYFKNEFEGIAISYSEENEPLGTGGAIKLALKKLNTHNEVLVLNGDTWASINYRDMRLAYHPPLTIAHTNGESAGVFIMEPDFLNHIRLKRFVFENVLNMELADFYPISDFIDIGAPKGYEQAKLKFMH